MTGEIKKAREALEAALRQLDINVSIARRDHPEGPIVDGKRLNIDALPHSQDILAGHVKDRIREAIAALDAEAKVRGDEINRMADAIDAARYAHPQHPRERDRPFSDADKGDREYAFRLARAAYAAIAPSEAEAKGSEPDFQTLVAKAKQAAADLYDWTSVNETEWTGWGDGEVPPDAEFWRVKAGQAVKALDELPSLPELRR